jgi:hypothetical protein
MTGTRSKVVIAGAAALEMNMARLRYAVPVLLLGLAACGSSPAASHAAASTTQPVHLQGYFRCRLSLRSRPWIIVRPN